MNSLTKSIQITPRLASAIRMMSYKKDNSTGTDEAIRAAGGAIAKMEVAHEEEYFYIQRQGQLSKLKEKSVGEAEYRLQAITDHEGAIQRHKEAIADLKTIANSNP